MANEKVFQSRIQLKHDIEENWLKATNFIPKEGEIIIYDIDANNSTPRFKVGDGTTVVSLLPFVFVTPTALTDAEIDEICNNTIEYAEGKMF